MNNSIKVLKKKTPGVIIAGSKTPCLKEIDKGLVPFLGKPIVEYVIEALSPQVCSNVICENFNIDILAVFSGSPDTLFNIHISNDRI